VAHPADRAVPLPDPLLGGAEAKPEHRPSQRGAGGL
jgi:hypothetical protein